MSKIVIILFAALAFEALFVHAGPNQEQRNQDVQDLLKQVEAVGSEAVAAVQNVQVEDVSGRRSLVFQCNELAHDIHEAIYQLQQAIDQTQGGHGPEVLQEVVKSLSNILHNVQQALNNEPYYLKAQIKSQVEDLVNQSKNLGLVLQQAEQFEFINDEVQDVLDNLLAAIQQLKVHNRLIWQTQEQINTQIQTVTNEVSNVIQSVSADNEPTVQDLACYSYHLAHHLGHVIDNVQREVHNQQGHVRAVLQKVVNKLSKIRTALEQAGLNEQSYQVSELKNLLKSNIQEIAAEVEKLVPVAYSKIDNEHETQHLRNVIHSVLARFQVVARQLQRDVEYTKKNNQK